MKVIKDISSRGVAFTLARVPGGDHLLYGCSDFKVYDLDLSQAKPIPQVLPTPGMVMSR